MAQMTCPACGKNNFAWAKRCDECRAPLTGEGRREATRVASAEQQTTSATPAPPATPVRSATSATQATPAPPGSLGCGVEPHDPAERDVQVQAVTDRVKGILAAGQKPEWIFLCEMADGGTLCLPPIDGRSSLLLFTSPILALDYLRAIGEKGRVGGVGIDSITELPRGCPALGVHSFCLNRCPRCNVAMAFPLAGLGSLDSFLKIWALERASRFLRGQRMARGVLAAQQQGMAQMKAAVEALRDHAAADNAHVYQLLAIIAKSQADGEAKAAALAGLKELQVPMKLETEDFARGLAEGMVGLLGTFELLNLPGAVRTT